MDRRAFLGTLAGGLLAAPLAAVAQQPDRVRRLGLLLPYIESDLQAQARVTAFRAALQERGWTDGRNVQFEFRYTDGQPDRLPALAADLAQRNVDVILTAGTESTAARRATKTIPLVMAAVGDPIAAGFIASLARPGGNITGASLLATELTAKRLQLLKDVLPQLTRLTVLWSAANASVIQKVKQIQAAAPQFRVQLHTFELRAPDDLEKGFDDAVLFGAQAVMTTEDAIQITYRARVVELGLRNRVPVASEFVEFAQAGALMSFGPSILDQFRYAASYVDSLFKGAQPGDLPVGQATRFELVINLKTAKALGLTIPPSLLQRADQVIE
ncbi:MAG: ABC transporter substrate-binding protein [Gemmatimonadales bacterium]